MKWQEKAGKFFRDCRKPLKCYIAFKNGVTKIVSLKVSDLGSEGIWIWKGRSILVYEMERQRCELAWQRASWEKVMLVRATLRSSVISGYSLNWMFVGSWENQQEDLTKEVLLTINFSRTRLSCYLFSVLSYVTIGIWPGSNQFQVNKCTAMKF